MSTAAYEIRIKGRLSDSLSGAFEDFTLAMRPAETIMRGELRDQSELHGVLDQIQLLGLELIEVRQLDKNSPELGASRMPPDGLNVPVWSPERPRLHPVRLAIAWLGSALALLLAAGLAPGAELKGFGGAVAVAAIVGILNAVLPPLVAALRLPFTVAIGFLLALVLDAAILMIAAGPRAGTAAGRRARATRCWWR